MADLLGEEALRLVDPAAASAVLGDRGWHQRQSPYPGTLLWTPPRDLGSPDATVLLPSDRDNDDFAVRISGLLHALVSVYGESEVAWYERLLTEGADVLVFSSRGSRAASGSIPVEDGLRVFNGIRDALAVAAKTSVDNRAYYGSTHWDEARRFLDVARFGQTQVGSYVVTVIAPTAAPSLSDDLALLDQPASDIISGRPYTSTLMKAVSSARSALDRFADTTDPTVFEDFVEDGVSSDLCSALAEITGGAGGDLHISAQWSRLDPPEEELPTDVSFRPDDVLPLTAGRAALKESDFLKGATVQGYVDALTRKRGDDGRGTVTVTALRGLPTRGQKVRIILSAEQYLVAVEAHRRAAPISASGDLTKSGTRYWLRGASGFEILQGRLL